MTPADIVDLEFQKLKTDQQIQPIWLIENYRNHKQINKFGVAGERVEK